MSQVTAQNSNQWLDVPKWVTMFITVLTVTIGGVMFISGVRESSIAASSLASRNEGAIELLDRKIRLIEQEQVRDQMNLKYLKDGLEKLSESVKETNEMNREFLLSLTKEMSEEKINK